LQAHRTLPKTEETAMTKAEMVSMPFLLATGVPMAFT
jgi:hypothetical protein